MDIRTMTDPEEIRLQHALDEAALRIGEWQRGRRKAPVANSVGPLQKAAIYVPTGDPRDLKSPNELYADHAEALANIRAYRDMREATEA